MLTESDLQEIYAYAMLMFEQVRVPLVVLAGINLGLWIFNKVMKPDYYPLNNVLLDRTHYNEIEHVPEARKRKTALYTCPYCNTQKRALDALEYGCCASCNAPLDMNGPNVVVVKL